MNEFNALLERAVRDTLGLLQWIDGLSEHLLEPIEDASPTAAGVRLRSEFILDGTHLHPRYIVHLEAALAALERGRRPAAPANDIDEAGAQPPSASASHPAIAGTAATAAEGAPGAKTL